MEGLPGEHMDLHSPVSWKLDKLLFCLINFKKEKEVMNDYDVMMTKWLFIAAIHK